MIELADPTRAGLFLPVITDNDSEDLLMLLNANDDKCLTIESES